MTDDKSEHPAPLRIAAPAPTLFLDPPAAIVAAWLMSEMTELQVERIAVDEIQLAIPAEARLGRAEVDSALRQTRYGGWALSEETGPPEPSAARETTL